MLKKVAEGVHVHESDFCRSNAIVVQGSGGVLLIDPGLRGDEMVQLADDIKELGQSVVVGFSTHPHWDHILWHERFGDVPRYGTSRCVASVKAILSNPEWEDRVKMFMPPDISDQIPLNLFGLISGLAAEVTEVPWDGPKVRVIEHQAHAPGHAALLIEERKVLIAGDMLSDILMPMLDFMNAADPIEDYLAALKLLEDAAGDVDAVIPGHGSVGDGGKMRARIKQDRAYVHTLRDGGTFDDPRIGPAATYDWVLSVHERQLKQFAQRKEQNGAS